MTSPKAPEPQERSLSLPISMATRSDLSRSIAELEGLDNFLRDSAIRQPGKPMDLPRTSKVFDELVEVNKLNMLQQPDREYLLKTLIWLRDHAPILHMSFSTEPSAAFVAKLITWLRKNISPVVILHIGLHPNIGAGCVLRTTNKYYDFSLRKRFAEHRDSLLKELFGTDAAKPIPKATPVVSEAKL